MKNVLIALSLSLAAMTVAANPTVEKNGVLANKEGRTLYTFDKDSAGKSNCNGGCLAVWPAFTVANASLATADFTIIKRDDGSQQWAYKGMPLYFYAADAKPGDVNGDGQGGVWHVLRASKKSADGAQPVSVGSYAGY